MTRLSRTLYASLSLIAAAPFLAAPALRADPPADAKKGVQQGYDRFNAAMGRKDLLGVLAVMTTDFVQVTEKGQKMEKAAINTAIQQTLAQAKTIKVTTVVQKVTLDASGKKATAIIRNVTHITLPNPQTGKDSVVNGTEDAQDTWVKTPKGWLIQRSQTKKSVQTLDGKPLNM